MKKKSIRAFSIGLSMMMAVAFMPTTAFADNAIQEGFGIVNSSTMDVDGDIKKSEQTDIYNYVGKTSLSGESEIMMQAESFPEVFDLSDGRITGAEGSKNVVTPVKFQNPYGTCWGFAAIAAAEGSIISEGVNKYGWDKDEVRENLDLSEKHLAWFARGKIEDESDSQNGEGVSWNKGIGKSDRYNTGGTMALATSLFSSGVGPVKESRVVDENYPDLLKYQGLNKEIQYKKFYDEEAGKYVTKAYCYSDEDDWSIPYKYRFYQSYKLEQSFVLPSPAGKNDGKYEYNEAGTNAIKKQLYEYGRPVAIAFQADTASPANNQDGKYINLTNWAHYTYDENTGVNHAVTIVGYDDNYSLENFNEGHQPPGNGAFLVKNSWGASENEFPNKGPGWGIEVNGESTGYFWLSYYDKSLDMAEAMDFDLDNPGDKEYLLDQYDNCNEEYPITDTSEELLKSSNVYTAECTERLFSVGCQTAAPNTEVTYEVYILNGSSENPEDGYLAASKSEVYEYGGYHKCALDDDNVIVQKGQKYAIVVTQLQPDGKYAVFYNAVFTKAMYEAYGLDSFWGEAVVNEGESFWYEDGEWNDFSEAAETEEDDLLSIDNFPIKGYGEKCSDLQMRTSAELLTFSNKGEKKTISLSFKGNNADIADDTITWVSSNENVVKLIPYKDNNDREDDSKIVIETQGAGIAYVYASNPQMGSVVTKISIVPTTPEVTYAKETSSGIKVSWNSVDLADGYKVTYGYNDKSMKTVTLAASKFSEGTLPSITITKPTAYVTYKFVISAFANDNDGNPVLSKSTTVYVTQKPATTSITSLKGTKKAFTVKWKKRSCSGYQIQYSTSKSMKSAKSVKITKSSTVSKKITGLKAKKKYYVRVRAYNAKNDSVSYSSWSAIKKVKTK